MKLNLLQVFAIVSLLLSLVNLVPVPDTVGFEVGDVAGYKLLK